MQVCFGFLWIFSLYSPLLQGVKGYGLPHCFQLNAVCNRSNPTNRQLIAFYFYLVPRFPG